MIITKTNIAGRIIGAAFAAAVLIGAPVAAMTIAPTATAHAAPNDIINLDGLCEKGTATDCDGDGLSNELELQAGTDPQAPNKLNLGLGDWKKNPLDRFIDGFLGH